MNWNWADWQALRPSAQRGRPGPRLIRGLIWAAVAIIVLSLLVFVAFHYAPPDPARFLR